MAGMAFQIKAARMSTSATSGRPATRPSPRGIIFSARHHAEAGADGGPPPGPCPPDDGGGPTPEGPLEPVDTAPDPSVPSPVSAPDVCSTDDGGSTTIVVLSSAAISVGEGDGRERGVDYEEIFDTSLADRDSTGDGRGTKPTLSR